MREDFPIYLFLEKSISMISGDEFEAIPFDPGHFLSEEERENVKIMAKPFAVAMLFNELLKRLKTVYPNMTAERLRMYFTNSARDALEILGTHDPWGQGGDLVSVALGFLDFKVVFDIDDNVLESEDEDLVTKFVDSVLPYNNSSADSLEQKKIASVYSFGKKIEEGMKERIDYIFAETNLTLPN
jgi:hypothetical protein